MGCSLTECCLDSLDDQIETQVWPEMRSGTTEWGGEGGGTGERRHWHGVPRGGGGGGDGGDGGGAVVMVMMMMVTQDGADGWNVSVKRGRM